MSGAHGTDAQAGAAARVLVTVPCLQLAGGVANYYRALRPLLDPGKIYFEIGARPGECGRWSALRRLAADFWNFHRELRRNRFDIVHLNPSLGVRSVLRDGLLLLIAKAHRLRVLVFFRGWDPACEERIRERYARPFRGVYGRADAIVVLAAAFARALRGLGLEMPIVTETTVVADAAISDHAGHQDGAAGRCHILYLSRLEREKGAAQAVQAVTALRRRYPAVTLTIAGDGPERSVAEALARREEDAGITFAGHVDGTARAEAFRNADVFFFPTFFGEGMPNCVLEAMAAGLPVVTRPVGGIGDFFEDGRMGFVSDSRDPAIFAGLLERLVSDPALRAAMGRYNRDYARRRFAASVVAPRLLEIYGRLAGQAAGR